MLRNAEHMTNLINANKIMPVDMGIYYDVGIDIIQHYSSHSEESRDLIRLSYMNMSAMMEMMATALNPENIIIISYNPGRFF